jgi:PLP dependent protein
MTSVASDLELAIRERITRIQMQIVESAARAGRDASDVTLVGVSKTVGRAAIDAAYAAGLRDFGENRVQDARTKITADVPADLRLHLIGSLQTNKVRQILGMCHLIHSVDRPALVEAIEARAGTAGQVQPILIQVNIAREEQKHGCTPEELPALTEAVLSCPHLELRGYMTMAPLVATLDEARPVFAAMRELRDRMQDRYREAVLTELSMGMTNDFPAAIEEGATIVRIGRAIFADTGTT